MNECTMMYWGFHNPKSNLYQSVMSPDETNRRKILWKIILNQSKGSKVYSVSNLKLKLVLYYGGMESQPCGLFVNCQELSLNHWWEIIAHFNFLHCFPNCFRFLGEYIFVDLFLLNIFLIIINYIQPVVYLIYRYGDCEWNGYWPGEIRINQKQYKYNTNTSINISFIFYICSITW